MNTINVNVYVNTKQNGINVYEYTYARVQPATNFCYLYLIYYLTPWFLIQELILDQFYPVVYFQYFFGLGFENSKFLSLHKLHFIRKQIIK